MTAADLSARLDGFGLGVILRVDVIRAETLDQLARAWADDQTAVIDALDRLAAVVQRTTDPDDDTGWHPAAIDAARDDLETVVGLDAAEVTLRPDTAIILASELQEAAGATFTAHIRGAAA
ncbi:hypothetical protein [Streptomyces natalensis]|uniref:Uncharacterized protein n=1 Tax=Streptomyces natalensis ATCC 27448 TaxID=1240678 RepID=A0A0D7CLC5_9ACTN|nr:hypothetical protein [Streptomyces natalensis]KIZ16881.1 hypothetical protein SNA_18025 [Streptomyces natalensis ATCC 27448]